MYSLIMNVPDSTEEWVWSERGRGCETVMTLGSDNEMTMRDCRSGMEFQRGQLLDPADGAAAQSLCLRYDLVPTYIKSDFQLSSVHVHRE